MTKMRLLVFCIIASFMILNMFSLSSAVSIVKNSSISESSIAPANQINPYVAQGSSSCGSTFVRTYVPCQRSAYPPQPRAESSYSAQQRYAESPGYEQYPIESTRINKNAQAMATNFDSSSSRYDYRGPMYERRIVQSDDFIHATKASSGFFNSKASDMTTHSVRNEVIEKYVGATESLYSDRKNDRVASQSIRDTSAQDYNNGFSFGKQRLYDSSEYGRDLYTGVYYYRPLWNGRYYNWGY